MTRSYANIFIDRSEKEIESKLNSMNRNSMTVLEM